MVKDQGFDGILAAARSQKKPSTKGNPSLMPFENIQDRASDTRQLNQKHVETLALSIAAIGLIEPLVVDKDGVLLAGGHRKAAIALLADGPGGDKLMENMFPGGVPVRIMPFSASDNPDKALNIEIAENEIRRDYSRDEVLAIAERLKQAGFEELKGRPKKGQKPLMPALAAVVGKSKRRIQQMMEEPKDESAKDFALSESDKHLQRAIASLEKWRSTKGRKKRESELASKIDSILDDLNKGLE